MAKGLNNFKLLLAFTLFFGTLQVSASAQQCQNLFISLESRIASASTQIPWFKKIDFTAVEKTLSHGEIVQVIALKEALEGNGKKVSGTTPGMAVVTFADGTVALWKSGDWAVAGEIAAYQLAREVGSRLVPPTVLRKITANDLLAENISPEMRKNMIDKTGSLQFFVHTSIDLLKLDARERRAIWQKVSEEQKSDRDIFNFVFGQWDRHWGNILIDDSLSIVSIDNGAIRSRQMVRYGELPFTKKLTLKKELRKPISDDNRGAFPFDQSIFLKSPSVEKLTQTLGPLIDAETLENYIMWRRPNKENPNPDSTMRIVFWDNSIWIQAIGYNQHGIIHPTVFPRELIDGYRRLTFSRLRQILPLDPFSDQHIREMLLQRDQILRAAEIDGMVQYMMPNQAKP